MQSSTLELVDKWNANWIWYPGSQWKVNFHFFVRKVFEIESPIRKAHLHISAFTDYKLFINGKYLGGDLNPSDPYHFQYYDSYSIKESLKEGKNVIGVICHNYAIGVHWQPAGAGGLILQCEIKTEKGICTIVTDETWKVKKGDCWSLDSPRMFWSCGFLETFDFRKYERDWLGENLDDSGWETPEILGKHPRKPWTNLIPREIPFLEKEPQKPMAVEKGKYKIQGFHAVSFNGVIPRGKNYIGCAYTYFCVDREKEVILFLSCDDAFKALLNKDLVLEQGYDEEFARTRVWYGQDDYEQRHYGLGLGKESTKVLLRSGWNKMLVVIDQGVGGWGFTLAFLDPLTGKSLNIPFSDVKENNKSGWTLAGPFESTGMNDSLNNMDDIIENIPEKIGLINYHPFDYEVVTDYARLMQAEKRTNIVNIPLGDELILNEGEFCIVDFAQVKIGYPKLEIDSPEEAIIDVGYNYVLSEDKKILFVGEEIRYVDRIYLREGEQTWEPLQRRTGRYLHISCRRGNSIRIRNIKISALGYPVEDIGKFECSYESLNRIWEVSKYTTRLLMQYGYQDCLRREEGCCHTGSFNYMSRSAGYSFGDYKLARKTLKLLIQTQNESGWFSGHGISSPNSDEPVHCLYWAVWLKDYYFWSGDISLIRETYENLKNNLRYFSKMINRYGLLDGRNESIIRRGQMICIGSVFLASMPQYRGIFDRELFGYNILYYAALNSAAILAEELGFMDEAKFYRKKAARVKKSSNERFWDENRELYIDWRKDDEIASTSWQGLLVIALYFDICDKIKAQKVLHYLCDKLGGNQGKFENYHLSFGGYYYFLEVLFRYGREDIALNLMKAYYGRWLELGGTTFSEYFELRKYKGKSGLEAEYETHAFGTSAHLHFYSNILGIKPLKAGFEEILFEPKPGFLTWAKGKVHTPKGEVTVSWRKEKSLFKIEIEVPREYKYKVKIPKGYKDYRVRVNDKIYNEIDRGAKNGGSITAVEIEKNVK